MSDDPYPFQLRYPAWPDQKLAACIRKTFVDGQPGGQQLPDIVGHYVALWHSVRKIHAALNILEQQGLLWIDKHYVCYAGKQATDPQLRLFEETEALK